MMNLSLTMLAGALIGFVFIKLKIPAGMMVGSIVGVATLNIFTDIAYMPYYGKILAQIIAGAFIGVGIEKGDLIRLKNIFKPALVLLIGMLILNIISGFLIYFTSPLDLVTSLMSSVPGGISDIPIISEEMGADSSKVALLQFIRLIFGIGIFPSVINKFSKLDYYSKNKISKPYKRTTTKIQGTKYLIITMIVAMIFGVIGNISGIPAATLVFSMISVIILKLKTNKACMPKWMRRFAQVLAGAYIGSSVKLSQIMEIKYLIIPSIVLIIGYFLAGIVIGNILHKKFNMPIDEAMLTATPAGAADMALISAEMGIQSSDVIVLQIIRMITVVSLFPQIIRLVISIVN